MHLAIVTQIAMTAPTADGIPTPSAILSLRDSPLESDPFFRPVVCDGLVDELEVEDADPGYEAEVGALDFGWCVIDKGDIEGSGGAEEYCVVPNVLSPTRSIFALKKPQVAHVEQAHSNPVAV